MPQCPCCSTAVEVGVPACPDCGLALGGLDDGEIVAAPDMPAWPIAQDGLPEKAVLLHTAANPTDCALKQSLLHGCGIPTMVQTPLANQFTTVIFGGPILGADLYVPECRLAEARTLLSDE